MKNKLDVLAFEHLFPANLPRELHLFFLDLIEKTCELSDTVYPINGIKKGNLISLHLKKDSDNIIYMSGFFNIDKENRCIEGEIYLDKSTIYIDSLITRLGEIEANEKKIYRILDKFTILNKVIKHEIICGNSKKEYYYNKSKSKVKLK